MNRGLVFGLLVGGAVLLSVGVWHVADSKHAVRGADDLLGAEDTFKVPSGNIHFVTWEPKDCQLFQGDIAWNMQSASKVVICHDKGYMEFRFEDLFLVYRIPMLVQEAPGTLDPLAAQIANPDIQHNIQFDIFWKFFSRDPQTWESTYERVQNQEGVNTVYTQKTHATISTDSILTWSSNSGSVAQ